MKHPVAVLDDVYYRPVTLVDVYVSNISDKKQTAKLVQYLHRDFPLPAFSHLKRVRSGQNSGATLQVVVCDGASDLEKITSVLNLEDCYKVLGKLYKVQVPKDPPLTRKQFDESKLYWPVNFHEDKRITKLLKQEIFTDKEISTISSNMEKAIEVARNSSTDKQTCIGAVIVDPVTDRMLAKAYDCRHGDHPLHHAIMLCIDLVAMSQGGGMWSFKEGMFYAEDKETHDTSIVQENLSVEDPQSDTNKLSTESSCGSQHLPAPTCTTYDNDKEKCVTKQKTGPYLCTGYDLYVTREPCIMCAMALVHSRIRRVFYGSPDPAEGALGSKYKLHTKSSLNHHYEVFSQVLETQCRSLLHGDVT